MTPSKTLTKPSGISSEKFKSVSLHQVDNHFIKGWCIELTVGDMAMRQTIADGDVEAVDYAIRDMLRKMISVIVDEVAAQRPMLKEKLCTS